MIEWDMSLFHNKHLTLFALSCQKRQFTQYIDRRRQQIKWSSKIRKTYRKNWGENSEYEKKYKCTGRAIVKKCPKP